MEMVGDREAMREGVKERGDVFLLALRQDTHVLALVCVIVVLGLDRFEKIHFKDLIRKSTEKKTLSAEDYSGSQGHKGSSIQCSFKLTLSKNDCLRSVLARPAGIGAKAVATAKKEKRTAKTFIVDVETETMDSWKMIL